MKLLHILFSTFLLCSVVGGIYQLATIFLIHFSASSLTYYITPDADYTGNGTAESPFVCLARAFRAGVAQSQFRDIHIIINGTIKSTNQKYINNRVDFPSLSSNETFNWHIEGVNNAEYRIRDWVV